MGPGGVMVESLLRGIHSHVCGVGWRNFYPTGPALYVSIADK